MGGGLNRCGSAGKIREKKISNVAITTHEHAIRSLYCVASLG
jgi:hypothetical protein